MILIKESIQCLVYQIVDLFLLLFVKKTRRNFRFVEFLARLLLLKMRWQLWHHLHVTYLGNFLEDVVLAGAIAWQVRQLDVWESTLLLQNADDLLVVFLLDQLVLSYAIHVPVFKDALLIFSQAALITRIVSRNRQSKIIRVSSHRTAHLSLISVIPPSVAL